MLTDQQPTQETMQESFSTPNASSGCLRRSCFVFVIVFALTCGGCGGIALFSPVVFTQFVKALQNAGLRTYILVLGVTGNPALKLTTFEVNVTGIGRVERDMGAFGLLFGEGAEVTGTVRVALGADLQNNGVGILSCEVDTSTIRTNVGRAPLSGSAFDTEQIEQAAYNLFKTEAARQAIQLHWGDARKRLQDQFASWALGLEVPEQPTLLECPAIQPPQTP